MKSKIFKIMGVALALVLTFTVGAAFMPANTVDKAEAAKLAWSGVNIPSTVSNVLVGNTEDLGPVAISPNFAKDSTVFAVINQSGATPTVYCSTDAGHTWIPTVSTLGIANDEGIALVVSPNYATDSTLFVAVQDPAAGSSGEGVVYRSTNGGISFGQLGVVNLAGAEIITSMDVSPDYDGVGVIAIGVADRDTATAAASARCLQVWGADDVLSWTGLDPGTNYDVSAVKFSPSYPIDSTILTVASLANAEPYLRPVVGGVWSSALATKVGATDIADLCRDGNAAGGWDLVLADIALPSDYSSTEATLMRVYVTIVGEEAVDVAENRSNVYRITGTTTGVEIATDMEERLYPIDYSGTFGEGTLIGGLYDATGEQADVYRTTNPTSAVVNWYAVSGDVNKPTGVLVDAISSANITANVIAWVKMSPDYETDSTVIVGTQGNDSAFGVSTDGAVSFNETGLIENAGDLSALKDIALSSAYVTDETIFLVSDADTASSVDTNVWVTTNGGLYWDRCFLETWTKDGVIALSNEFATDSVVYVGDKSGTEVYYSANAGKTWSERKVASATGVEVQTMAAPDATTLYVGDSASGNVAKSINSGWTWPAAFVGDSGATGKVMSLKVKESTVVVGGTAGTVRRSDDGGATWTLVGGAAAGGATSDMYVAFDGTTVWAADEGGPIYRSVDGGAWWEIAATTTGTSAVELVLADDGTMYTAGTYTTTVTVNDVLRSIDPDAALPKPDATFQAMVAADAAIVAMDVTSGNIVAIIQGTSAYMYTDTLSAGIPGPTLVSPADGSYLTTAYAVFGIEAIPGATAYDVWWATDSAITSRVTTLEIDAPAVQVGDTVTEGYTIYWMARAKEPFNSPWSEVWTFHTALITAVVAPSLVSPGSSAGSTVDVPLEPVLNWSAFKYASGYEMQLAKDSGMTDFIADMTGANALGNVTSWKCTTKLAYSTTYFWRVRAIMGTATTYSDWSNVVGFTTMAKPVAPTPPVIVEPTPPAPVLPTPTTPAYIWGIIAIGAVLVIVVVVLIVRTRRVP